MAKIKIVSDGTTKNTTVVDADTGEAIVGVQSVALSVINGEWVAEITVAKTEIEFTVEPMVRVGK